MDQNSKRAKIRNPNKSSEETHDDRLSTLPEPLLIDILSLLPIKSAASTAVLSQRWRNLWTQITSLTLDYRHFQGTPNHLYSNCDRIVTRLASPSLIRSFALGVDNSSECPPCLLLGSWFLRICSRNVRHVKVSVNFACVRRFTLKLPLRVFQIESLVSLELINVFRFEFPDGKVVLPNLKSLVLLLNGSQCSVVGKLTRACPLLEQLSLFAHLIDVPRDNRYDVDNNDDGGVCIVDVFSGSLKILRMGFYYLDSSTKILINAPNLHFLYFQAGAVTCSFVTSPAALAFGAVKTCSETLAFSLLRMISSVTSLLLDLVPLHALKGFSNSRNDDGKPLIFKNLECLKLDLISQSVDDLCWTANDNMPSGFLTHVECVILEISKLTNETQLLNLIKCLLSSAHALKKFFFCVSDESEGTGGRNEGEAIREMKFISELSDCPHSSTQCQIEISGKYVVASSVLGLRLRTANGSLLTREEIRGLVSRKQLGGRA